MISIKEIIEVSKRSKKNKKQQDTKLVVALNDFDGGFKEGYQAAVQDIIGSKINIDTFEAEDVLYHRNEQSPFSLGYELGYKTKLCEYYLY